MPSIAIYCTVLPGGAGATEGDKAGKAGKEKAAEVDFGAQVAKKVVHSPRQEYVPPAEQVRTHQKIYCLIFNISM